MSLQPSKVIVGLVLCVSIASAQTVIDDTEILAKDRPEAWTMKLIGSELQMTAPVPGYVKAWSIEVGAEAGWIPSLNSEQRRIGFDGTKEEDVNRTPAYFRPRLSVGLPWQVSAGLGYIPPIRIGGIRPNHLTWSVGRPIASGAGWRLGGRLHGQLGELDGDVTCDAETVTAGEDPIRNPFGCEEPSDDRIRLRSVSIEMGGAFPVSEEIEPHLAAGLNYFDNEFQVDARYSGIVDRKLLLSSGPTFSLTGGVAYQMTQRIHANFDVLYVPLTVRRQGTPVDDGLFNVRISITYLLR